MEGLFIIMLVDSSTAKTFLLLKESAHEASHGAFPWPGDWRLGSCPLEVFCKGPFAPVRL